MYHYIYKVSDSKSKYYVGRHSTENLNDGYLGSGKWVRSIKNKKSLKKEILQFAESFEELLEKEKKFISEVIEDPMNMNFNNNSCGFGCGDNNPSRSEEGRKRRREENWMKTEEGRRWLSKNNPSKKSSVKSQRSEKCKEQWEKSIHNFQKQESIEKKQKSSIERFTTDNPMWKKEIRDQISKSLSEKYQKGEHNFCDPLIREKSKQANKKRLLVDNPMKNPEVSSKLKKPKEKVECPHCKKSGGKPVMMRYHFDKCKLKDGLL